MVLVTIATNLIAKKRALSAVQDIDNPVANEEGIFRTPFSNTQTVPKWYGLLIYERIRNKSESLPIDERQVQL